VARREAISFSRRGEQNRKTTSNPTDANSVLSRLLKTADLKKRVAAFCMAAVFLMRSSSADAAFEYFI